MQSIFTTHSESVFREPDVNSIAELSNSCAMQKVADKEVFSPEYLQKRLDDSLIVLSRHGLSGRGLVESIELLKLFISNKTPELQMRENRQKYLQNGSLLILFALFAMVVWRFMPNDFFIANATSDFSAFLSLLDAFTNVLITISIGFLALSRLLIAHDVNKCRNMVHYLEHLAHRVDMYQMGKPVGAILSDDVRGGRVDEVGDLARLRCYLEGIVLALEVIVKLGYFVEKICSNEEARVNARHMQIVVLAKVHIMYLRWGDIISEQPRSGRSLS